MCEYRTGGERFETKGIIGLFGFLKKRTKSYTVGDTLFLGKYPQNACENTSPIEWVILDISDGIALLISKYAIIPSGYCSPDADFKSLEWVNSIARKVCNDVFYNSAFNSYEKSIICKKTIEQLSICNLSETVCCEDNVFILSEDEVNLFLSDSESRKARPTEYVRNISNLKKWSAVDDYIPWWLLPQYDIGGTVTDLSGKNYSGMIYPKAVNQKGEIHYHGRNVYHSDFAIKPCIQINIEAYKSSKQK